MRCSGQSTLGGRVTSRVWLTTIVLILAGCRDEPAAPLAVDEALSPEQLVRGFFAAYGARDVQKLETTLHPEFEFTGSSGTYTTIDLCKERWLCAHRSLFGSPLELRGAQVTSVDAVDVSLGEVSVDLFTWRGGGLDPARWRMVAGYATMALRFDFATQPDRLVRTLMYFVVAEDLSLAIGEPRKFALYLVGVDLLGTVTPRPAPAPIPPEWPPATHAFWAELLVDPAASCAACP